MCVCVLECLRESVCAVCALVSESDQRRIGVPSASGEVNFDISWKLKGCDNVDV